MDEWDTYSKLNVGQGILMVHSFGCLWLRKLAKAMTKALKRQNGILAQLFMKIMEIGRKRR